VREIGNLIELGGFKVVATYQTMTEMNLKTVKQPLPGYGRGIFVVIKGKKRQ